MSLRLGFPAFFLPEEAQSEGKWLEQVLWKPCSMQPPIHSCLEPEVCFWSQQRTPGCQTTFPGTRPGTICEDSSEICQEILGGSTLHVF